MLESSIDVVLSSGEKVRTPMKWLKDEGLFGWNWWYLLTHPWIILKEAYYHTKWFLQRGHRGYSDQDSWSIDGYLNSWMPQAIRELKVGWGYPIQVYLELFPEDDIEKVNEAHTAIAQARWHEILETIAMGFEAGKKISEYEFEGPNELNALETQLNKGLRLFSTYYLNFWS